MEMISKDNATNLRKYFVEYAVLFLTGAVIFLFYQYANLNDKIINLQTTVIKENTKSTIEFNQQLQNLKNFH